MKMGCSRSRSICNCQAGVFLAYASSHGATLLDRQLYLPEAWLSDPAFAERRARCRIPEDVTFQTKNELTWDMVRAVVESGALRCRWFLADEAFGRDTVLLDAVDGLGLWSMVDVPLGTPIWLADASAATTPRAGHVGPLFSGESTIATQKRSDADASPGLPVAERLVAASGTNP